MRFLEPGFLVFLFAALLPWVGPFVTADRRHALLRSAAMVLVVFALARPVRVVPDDLAHRVVVVDRTASVTDSADRAALEWVRGALAADRDARWTVVSATSRERNTLEMPDGVRTILAGSVEEALAAAAAAVPPGAARAGVALLTDGQVSSDATARAHALLDLAQRGIPVDVVTLDGLEGDLRAIDLVPTAPARAGREVTLIARLVGAGQVVDCELWEANQVVATASGIRVDGEARVPLAYVPEEGGFDELELNVKVTDGVDPRGGDLVLTRTLPVDDPLRVRYLGERMQGGGERLAELLGPGFAVEAGADLEGAFDHTDVVVLDDRPAASFPTATQEELAARVKEGALGLVATGGEASFGPGGYHEEPVEELLPVEFVQKEEKRDPSTTLVVIIDTSGSMGGNRVQLAKEVSRLAIRRLLPHDKVGMVEFYGAKRWAVPIQPASNSIEIERALNRLDAGGGTVILPAIEEAYYGLKNVRTRYKHVLILTDGGVETGAFEPLVRRMADDGMNVSTVLIGPDAHSEFLVNIANWGQGRFYSVPNRFNLPEILLKQPASAKLPAYRPGIVNVRARGGPVWWGEVDPESTPPVAGYVETRPRPGAEVVLETAEENHPILASWRYGLGRVTAMTTEPTGAGTEPWSDWDGYGELLARAVERTANDARGRFEFELRRVPGGALVVAQERVPTGVIGTILDSTSYQPLVRRESGRIVPLRRVAPDRLEAFFETGPGDTVRLECGEARSRVSGGINPVMLDASGQPLASFDERVDFRIERRLALDRPAGSADGLAEELQAPHENAQALIDEVAATGGSTRALSDVAPGSTALTEAATPSRIRLREYAPLFALLALLLYLFDVAYRRWPRTTAA